MNKFLALTILVFASVPAFASTDSVVESLTQQVQSFTMRAAGAGFFNWHVGDKLNFKVTTSPIPGDGTATLAVTKDDADGYTLEEIANLLGQKQDIVMVLDRNTGAVKKLTVNGQDQTPPNPSDYKIIKQVAAEIDVPAGHFKCVDVVIQDKTGAQSEEWVAPGQVPISGMLKSSQVAQGFLTVVMELTSFEKGH